MIMTLHRLYYKIHTQNNKYSIGKAQITHAWWMIYAFDDLRLWGCECIACNLPTNHYLTCCVTLLPSFVLDSPKPRWITIYCKNSCTSAILSYNINWHCVFLWAGETSLQQAWCASMSFPCHHLSLWDEGASSLQLAWLQLPSCVFVGLRNFFQAWNL